MCTSACTVVLHTIPVLFKCMIVYISITTVVRCLYEVSMIIQLKKRAKVIENETFAAVDLLEYYSILLKSVTKSSQRLLIYYII